MSDNLIVKDATGSVQTLRSTDNGGIQTPHHIVDTLPALPSGSNHIGEVAVSNFPGTQPVSAASLPLPTGAATAAAQATQGTSLGNIDANAGAVADAAVVADANGTMSAKLRGLVKMLADVWDSVNHGLKLGAGANHIGEVAVSNFPAGAPNGALIDRGGTITGAGVSQQVMAANSGRKYLFFQNTSDQDMWIDFGATAVLASPSILLIGGRDFTMSGFASTQAVNVICGTIALTFSAKEG